MWWGSSTDRHRKGFIYFALSVLQNCSPLRSRPKQSAQSTDLQQGLFKPPHTHTYTHTWAIPVLASTHNVPVRQENDVCGFVKKKNQIWGWKKQEIIAHECGRQQPERNLGMVWLEKGWRTRERSSIQLSSSRMVGKRMAGAGARWRREKLESRRGGERRGWDPHVVTVPFTAVHFFEKGKGRGTGGRDLFSCCPPASLLTKRQADNSSRSKFVWWRVNRRRGWGWEWVWSCRGGKKQRAMIQPCVPIEDLSSR